MTLKDYIDRELRRRYLHRAWTERPYEDCLCSEGGPCKPKDPAQRPVLEGLLRASVVEPPKDAT